SSVPVPRAAARPTARDFREERALASVPTCCPAPDGLVRTRFLRRRIRHRFVVGALVVSAVRSFAADRRFRFFGCKDVERLLAAGLTAARRPFRADQHDGVYSYSCE